MPKQPSRGPLPVRGVHSVRRHERQIAEALRKKLAANGTDVTVTP